MWTAVFQIPILSLYSTKSVFIEGVPFFSHDNLKLISDN